MREDGGWEERRRVECDEMGSGCCEKMEVKLMFFGWVHSC